jgi:3-oxoacyl-[acyl-carrier-protein] synthase II
MVIGEGGAIVVLESLETFKARKAAQPEARAYAEVLGFGASQTINPGTRNLMPDPQGKGIALAIRAALRDANIGPEAIDLIVPFGLGAPDFDRAELAAIQAVLGAHAKSVAMAPLKPLVGNCGAGAGGLDVCVAAKAIAEQTLPMAGGRRVPIRAALTVNISLGGQNAAIVLGRVA